MEKDAEVGKEEGTENENQIHSKCRCECACPSVCVMCVHLCSVHASVCVCVSAGKIQLLRGCCREGRDWDLRRFGLDFGGEHSEGGRLRAAGGVSAES